MERFLQDLKFAVRTLAKNKGFTIAAVVTLAVCVAANVAVFCIVNSVVLRPLVFPEADRLLAVYNSYPKAGAVRAGAAVPDYFDRRARIRAFAEVALFANRGQTIGSTGNTERVPAQIVTPSLFPLLRVQALRGRVFREEEGQVGRDREVILSFALWQRRFAGRPDAVGKDLRVNGVPHTVVGVLPADFHFIGDAEEPLFYTPAAFTNEEKSDDNRHSNSFEMVARLAPGATLEQARQELAALDKLNLERFPEYKDLIVGAGHHTVAMPLQDDMLREVKSRLYLLWAGALFVLLIGGVNVANLVLARATSRLKELATRHVLGATLARLARQMLTETTLLTLTGGVVGLALGSWTLTLLRTQALEQLPRRNEIGLDATVVAFTIGVSVAMGFLLGVVPVLSIRKSNLNQAFREEGRSSTGGRRARFLRTAFVTAQIAIALMLLVSAGLLFTSFGRVLSLDPGYRADHVVTAQVSLAPLTYPKGQNMRAFFARALDAVRALPGVTQAGVSSSVPFGDSFNLSVICAEGYVMAPGESIVAPLQIRASDGYLEALRARLVRGRLFDRRDTDTSMPVTIVDERLARRFWPNADPIGRRLFRPENPKDRTPGPKTRFITVVGVVNEMKYVGMTPGEGGIEPVGTCYFAAAQEPFSNVFLTIRTTTATSAIVQALRKAIASIDPEMPVYDVRSLQERQDRFLANRRTPMLLALAFAAVALFLAAIGVYAVLAYQVAQRTREIGIRMALGSEAGATFKLVLRDGVRMLALGVVLGLAGAVAMSRTLQSQLFGVGALDPGVISLVAGLLALVAVIACAVPAIRATRVNPVQALTDQ